MRQDTVFDFLHRRKRPVLAVLLVRHRSEEPVPNFICQTSGLDLQVVLGLNLGEIVVSW